MLKWEQSTKTTYIFVSQFRYVPYIIPAKFDG